MKTFRFSKNQKGNAILISLGVTSFMFVVAAGAGSLIDASLRQSPKLVNSGKAFYAAEGAVESALFQASGRTSGFETNLPPTLDMQHLNKTQGSYSASSREDINRTRDDGAVAHNHTMYIPPRTVSNTATDGVDEFEITSLTGNWKKVRFGQAYPFDLFVDDSEKFMGTEIGDPDLRTEFRDCEDVLATAMNKVIRCHSPVFFEGDFYTYANSCDLRGFQDYIKIESCNIPPPTNNDGDTCEAPNIIGPNDICSSETKSILENEFGNPNTNIESVFFDVYIPNAKKPVDTSTVAPVMSWRMEGKTYKDLDVDFPPQLEIFAANRCQKGGVADGEGTICAKYFDSTTIPPDTSYGKSVSRYQDGDNGTWVRIENPMGIMKGKEKVFPASIFDFMRKEITNPITENILNNYRLYFPRLTVQMGKAQMWEVFSGADQIISEAYIRIGFRYFEVDFNADNSIIQDFPIPSDKTTIQATGNADGYTQKINVEITPQEIAPMFEYAVFQP